MQKIEHVQRFLIALRLGEGISVFGHLVLGQRVGLHLYAVLFLDVPDLAFRTSRQILGFGTAGTTPSRRAAAVAAATPATAATAATAPRGEGQTGRQDESRGKSCHAQMAVRY